MSPVIKSGNPLVTECGHSPILARVSAGVA